MASETEVWPQSPLCGAPWPPDDTEESVVGTDLHQKTIINLRWGINEVARMRMQAERAEGVPWQALSQTIVMGFERPDGTRYKTLPDVFVYRRAIDQNRGSVAVGVDGPPTLIIEVLSESTYDVDLNLAKGKGYSYARAGVREYLALDPTGAFSAERVSAWRLEDGVYRPWYPDGDGRWQSAEIAVAFGLEGVLATVYTRDGQRMLREGEIQQELARQQAATAAELARQQAEIERLHRLLEERRRDDE